MSLTKLYNDILPQASAFLGVFFVVMIIGYSVLTLIDFVPEPVNDNAKNDNATSLSTSEQKIVDNTYSDHSDSKISLTSDEVMPISLSIPTLDRTLTISNPSSSNIDTLDAALLKGVVRHPESADLGGPGNILILGHSSYLKNVFNKNYQAFNGIQELSWGDQISLKSADMEYVYQVDKVYKAPASEVEVPTGGDEYKLTLVTCNVFGAKEDRFIVEASLISKKAL